MKKILTDTVKKKLNLFILREKHIFFKKTKQQTRKISSQADVGAVER